MINIFNLFLVLFTFWFFLIFANFNLNFITLIIGLICCSIIAYCSWKFKLINRKTEFLFLIFGFYKFFFSLFIISLYNSFLLLFEFLKFTPQINPVIYNLPFKNSKQINIPILISAITLIPGISFIDFNKNHIVIYCLNEKLVKKANLKNLISNLQKINDNSIV